MRVLIVDDDRDFAEAFAETVAAMGHDVAYATSGRRSIELASTFEPDVAFLDVVLPDINGVTLAGLLRGVVDHELHVVGLTGLERATLSTAVARGILDARLQKPVSVEAIRVALANPLTKI